ncbi:cobalamin biosynthesis protein CbiD [Aminipila butyrica]|uniref:Cobalt-precorrin-5B C(1)-methyltransferase n=1 Tax=Aminipila butyrica TaxID=433296 RepID=A0A858BU75_9FIRM|nr:cobalt-precorrin-5B (C(1))-methyltransferase CbiD [Aminipila butyrica]QIB69493.1 cobalamin biosynthesis protein CbiD [Aminipila butyrica]
MQEEQNKQLNPKAGQLRRGYTTGTCAAAAAKAAAMLALGEKIKNIQVDTPKGIPLTLMLQDIQVGQKKASCAIQKDSGDDPDITHGILVYGEVELLDQPGPILIDGGTGVGRVTLPGLACDLGQAAINPVPRKMIGQMVSQAFDELGYEGGAKVTISIPKGEELARRTYNPRLGIEGGLSVLGTSGIVEPMSEQALIDTIKVEMDVQKALGAEYLVITPGNYGEKFLKEHFLQGEVYSVKCSNFIGDSLDYAEGCGFKGILFVGHIGKLVKVAGGIMNTHSKYADARMEILSAHAARLGAEAELIEGMMNAVTTDSAYELLEAYSPELKDRVLQALMDKIEFHLKSRTHQQMEIGAVMFSNKHGYLGKTSQVDAILEKIESSLAENK